MRINTNVASMTAQANNAQVNKNLTNSLEKLSSGLRINKAADDASGMAIADKLRTQASSIGQGIANANSANALIQIADKALGEQSNILDAVKTKLIQAATSTTSEEGREAIRKDISKLLEQMDSISAQTSYNGINLLNEKNAEFTFQVGEMSSSNIKVKTAYAINTNGLGATNDVPADADASLRYGQAGSVGINGNDTELTVQNNSTVANANRAIAINNNINSYSAAQNGDVTFKVTAKEVESINFTTTAATNTVVIKTTDAEMIDKLNSISITNTAMTKNADGMYTMTGSVSSIDFGGSKVDISDLEFSGVSQTTTGGDVVYIETDNEVSVTKLNGENTVSIDSATVAFSTLEAFSAATITATLAGKGSAQADGIAFGNGDMGAGDGVFIEEGTMSAKVIDADIVADASIGINTIADQTLTVTASEASFVISANQVEKLTLHSGAGGNNVSVMLTTSDATTMATLTELSKFDINLTKVAEGTYTFASSAAGADAILEFSEKIDLKNLTIAGANNGEEQIFIQTDETVTVTKNGTKDDPDVSVASFTGITASSLANMSAAITDKASTLGSLVGLKELAVGGLTSQVANDYMSNVDAALNQLNLVRSDFGSTQNQLDAAIRNMMVTEVNIKAAESVIRDVDYAKESANFNKQNIIAQAGTYALSQANNVQQNVMKLLQ